jgi:hypothetical protein
MTSEDEQRLLQIAADIADGKPPPPTPPRGNPIITDEDPATVPGDEA